MMRAVICKGDPTSHGGTVLEGNELIITNGGPVAQRGHMTFCPQCKGNFPIIEGIDFHTYAGIGTAVDGVHTACGAKLVATQHAMIIDDNTGAAQSAGSGATSAATASTDATASAKFGGSFQAVDEQTGQPVAGLAYRMILPDATVLRGVTNSEGRTERVTGHDPATIVLHWDAEAASDQI